MNQGAPTMIRRLAVLVAIFTLAATAADAATTYNVTADTTIRSTVLFVGDSNITRGAAQIVAVLTTRMDGAHLPVFGSRTGTGIRGYGPVNCPPSVYPTGCAASDYWKLRIANILRTVTPTAIVVDLGGNDAPLLGTPTGLGYADYATKIDWLLAQLPAGVPVIWTNLPCTIYPAPFNGHGCDVVNNQLYAARARHPDLTVLPWRAASLGHPEYMGGPGIAPHFSPAGYTAWARLINSTLDARFPA